MSSDEDLVAVCRKILNARTAEREGLVARDQLFAAVKDAHPEVPRTRFGDWVKALLLEHGFTEDEVDRLGVRNGTVRVALDRPRSIQPPP